MRVISEILTALAAFCVFGIGWAAQENQLDQAMVEKATKGRAVDDVTSLGIRRNRQEESPRFARVSASSKSAQSTSKALQEPTCLKQPLLFTPNQVNLNVKNRKALNCAATWLREHREARVLIVGYCDGSGSEACTAELAERRAEGVRQFLMRYGTQADQIAGVKAWENEDRLCRAATSECQRGNRSVRLFVAGPAGSLK